ncbi:MAG TPA: hypothetical protein VMY42_22625 [Thermoguttaceae bacterium]|nr:hypothetical protein [Thermoguttaceae bacterium]
MRSRTATQHRNRRQNAASVSLFPFLAVLICTMGALIVLLVVLARQAKLQATETAAAEAEQREEEAARRQKQLNESHEDVLWRIEQWKASRQQTEVQLKEARLRLGHIEEHALRLRDQLAQLQATLRDLDLSGSEGIRHQQDLEAELARVQAEIAEADRRLADARRAAAERRQSYAVVPYRGPNQTHRQPIYIECRPDSVIIQPEGIVLGEEDFSGPMGPGNPLAVALRSIREYLLARSAFDPKKGLYDPEKSEEPYPLILIRPGGIVAYYAVREAMKDWASDFGYELVGEDWNLEFQPPDAQLAQAVHRAVEPARVRQRQLAAAERRQHGSSGATTYRVTQSRGGIVRADGLPEGFGAGTDFRSEEPAGPIAAQRTPGESGSSQETPRPADHFPGRPPEGTEHSPGDTPLRPGEWRPDQREQTTAEHSASEQPPRPDTPSRRADSLAKTRGADWALQERVLGAVPVSRPIRIDCHGDRLVIVSDRGQQQSRSVSLGPIAADSMDALVSGVWDEIDSWGIAGNGMYWRPVLNVHVAPDGWLRYEELKALLDGSGIHVQLKGFYGPAGSTNR